MLKLPLNSLNLTNVVAMSLFNPTGQVNHAVSLPACVALTPGQGGLERLLIDAPAGYAEIYLFGAHITSWVPRGGKEVLFTSSRAVFNGQKAIRGGIPLCLPWFGVGALHQAPPAHGWARNSVWQLRSVVTTDDGGVRVTLSLEKNGFYALYEVTVGEKLELNLSLRNVQSEPVVGELTFHTYLRLYDLTATDLSGLAGGEYIDNEPGATRAKQEQELKVAGSCDRIFTTGEAGNVVRVRDSGNRRTIVVTKHDAPNTVVWNPGPRGAAEFSDMAPDEWVQFLCVEPGRIRENAAKLEPGESFSISMTLSVENL